MAAWHWEDKINYGRLFVFRICFLIVGGSYKNHKKLLASSLTRIPRPNSTCINAWRIVEKRKSPNICMMNKIMTVTYFHDKYFGNKRQVINYLHGCMDLLSEIFIFYICWISVIKHCNHLHVKRNFKFKRMKFVFLQLANLCWWLSWQQRKSSEGPSLLISFKLQQ